VRDATLLSDPQQLNSYSYARNNPITYKDVDGRKVELASRPVFDIGARSIGAHTFFILTPDNPNAVHVEGVPSGTTAFTLGAYNPNALSPLTNKLEKGIGTKDSPNTDSPYAFDGAAVINKTTITPPKGQSDTDFINNMGSTYNGIDLSGMNYNMWGNVPGLYDANSNNFARTLGRSSGVEDQMNAFNPNPSGKLIHGAPGYGAGLPSTSIYRQIQGSINSIKASVQKLMAEESNE
jgi:hypothetical protein